jgi:hypothetical protein
MRRTSDATRDVVTLGFRENPRHVSILFVEAGLLGASNRIEAERRIYGGARGARNTVPLGRRSWLRLRSRSVCPAPGAF